MATVEIVFKQILDGEPCNQRWHVNNLAVAPGTPGVAADVADAFNSIVKPKINAIQAEAISNVEIYARELGNLAGAVTIAASGAGAVATDPENVLPPDLPIFLKLTIGSSINVETNLPYVGDFPVRGGRKFFAGLQESWIDVNGADVPAALDTAWQDFQEQIEDGFDSTTPTTHWDFVVFSPNRDGDHPMGARAALIAPITAVVLRRATRLLTRRP